jgi:magnesium transporter
MRKRNRPSAAKVGRFIGHAIDSTVGTAVDQVGKALTSSLRLAGLDLHHHPDAHHHRAAKPGSVSGIEAFDVDTPPPPDTVHFTVIDYGPDLLNITRPDDLAGLLEDQRPENATVRWINVDGLHPYVVKRFLDAYEFHTLAAEDTLHVPQRPKAERYDDHLYIATRMMQITENVLTGEQVSFFLKPGLLITFQEKTGDLWDPIRGRLEVKDSRIRKGGADYLLYALLDATVDHCFPILERFGDLLEGLEMEVFDGADEKIVQRIYGIKRELAVLRRVLWPTREMIGDLLSDQTTELSDSTKLFMRDVHEHAVQLVEIVETFRDMTSSLTDLHMSAVGNRMNEIMKFLTIMGSLFIPITFLAGIYGMNFAYIPELNQPNGYFVFWGVCLVVTAVLLLYFRKKGWLGGG